MYKIIATIPAEKAFRPLADGQCPLVAELIKPGQLTRPV